MKRIDDLNRTERFFTSTLLGYLLIHNNLEGVKEFLNWLEREKQIVFNDINNLSGKRAFKLPLSKPDQIEVNTELNFKRDLKFLKNQSIEKKDYDDIEKQNVPDLIIIYGNYLIVIEAKFFDKTKKSKFESQLVRQKTEIDLVINYLKPKIKYWCHIFLGPISLNLKNCDLELTWKEIEDFSRKLLGDDHYVTERIISANKKYSDLYKIKTNSSNYIEKCSFPEINAICKEQGTNIVVGFYGGINKFQSTNLKDLKKRKYKYDYLTRLKGKKDNHNWFRGDDFLKLVEMKNFQTKNSK